MCVAAGDLLAHDEVQSEPAKTETPKTSFEQMSFFDEIASENEEAMREKEAADREKEAREKEYSLQKAVVGLQKRYGKNAVLKGMNLEEGATAIERNGQIGGHKA